MEYVQKHWEILDFCHQQLKKGPLTTREFEKIFLEKKYTSFKELFHRSLEEYLDQLPGVYFDDEEDTWESTQLLTEYRTKLLNNYIDLYGKDFYITPSPSDRVDQIYEWSDIL